MATEFNKYRLSQKWFEDDYTEMLLGLLPKGFIWIFEKSRIIGLLQDVINSPDPPLQDSISSSDIIQDVIESNDSEGNVLRRFMSCFAAELERLEATAWSLLNQTDPGVALSDELLTDWERVLGLPEECFAEESTTVADRQRIAHGKLFNRGITTTKTFYEDYCETLGFDVTVTEIPGSSAPRRMGVARMGYERMGGSGGASILQITINSGTGNVDVLKCAIDAVKQAHVTVVWIE